MGALPLLWGACRQVLPAIGIFFSDSRRAHPAAVGDHLPRLRERRNSTGITILVTSFFGDERRWTSGPSGSPRPPYPSRDRARQFCGTPTWQGLHFIIAGWRPSDMPRTRSPTVCPGSKTRLGNEGTEWMPGTISGDALCPGCHRHIRPESWTGRRQHRDVPHRHRGASQAVEITKAAIEFTGGKPDCRRPDIQSPQ